MAQEPNHHIKYDQWELDMYISPIQLSRARSGGTFAQGYICEDFRKACEKEHGEEFTHWDGDVKWEQLHITVLPPSGQQPTGRHKAS